MIKKNNKKYFDWLVKYFNLNEDLAVMYYNDKELQEQYLQEKN